MYEQYRETKSYDEYFARWKDSELENLNLDIKQHIYNKYFVKSMVFQRDNFQCQNEGCKTNESKLTLHHTKFQKNNGKWTIKNCVTICKSCHQGFHKGAIPLTYFGMTYKIHKEPQIDWKQIKAGSKAIRDSNRDQHGIRISWDMVLILMKFLFNDKIYEDCCFDDDN